MISFLNAESVAPIEIHRQLCHDYGHTQLDGQRMSCRNSAGRCLIIIHPITRTSRPVISFFSYTSRNSNLYVTSPASQLILQPFRRFTCVAAHSPTIPSLHLRHSSFSNPSFAFSTSQALHLRHSSFSNPSVASLTSQFILQPFCRFTYVTVHSPTLLSLHLRDLASRPVLSRDRTFTLSSIYAQC